MKIRTIALHAGFVLAATAVGAQAGPGYAHTVTGAATCDAATFYARAFDAGVPPSTPGATMRLDVAVTFADAARDFSRTITADVFGRADLSTPLGIRGVAVVDGWAVWTGRDGNNGNVRVDMSPNDPTSPSAFVVCPDSGPTPAPEPTPGEIIPTPAPATSPVVLPPRPDRPPVVLPRKPDKPPKRKPRKRPRVVTCAFVLGHYPPGPARRAMLRRHKLPATCGRPFRPAVLAEVSR